MRPTLLGCLRPLVAGSPTSGEADEEVRAGVPFVTDLPVLKG
ncbi:hypothetical protein [Tabrizicola oligotrophica]|nr:hypothetical protein [Tabrizicola oligotrophica]